METPTPTPKARNPTAPTTPQRADYMAGKVTHQAYYESWARYLGISFKGHDLLPRIKGALANGDEHLNTIPLREWDGLAFPFIGGMPPGPKPWLRSTSYHPSEAAALAGLAHHGSRSASASDIVCALKAAARRDAEEVA